VYHWQERWAFIHPEGWAAPFATGGQPIISWLNILPLERFRGGMNCRLALIAAMTVSTPPLSSEVNDAICLLPFFAKTSTALLPTTVSTVSSTLQTCSGWGTGVSRILSPLFGRICSHFPHWILMLPWTTNHSASGKTAHSYDKQKDEAKLYLPSLINRIDVRDHFLKVIHSYPRVISHQPTKLLLRQNKFRLLH
jgi:hypothetical protein